jgi:hypothetical protein
MGLDWSAVGTGWTGIVTVADEYGQLGDGGISVCAISSVSCSIIGQEPVRAGLVVVSDTAVFGAVPYLPDEALARPKDGD